MKIRYIFCMMCIMLLTTASSEAAVRLPSAGQVTTAVERRVSNTMNLFHKKLKTRPIVIARIRPFGVEVLNAVRKDMGSALLRVKSLNLSTTNWQKIAPKIDIKEWSSALVKRYGEGRFEGYVIKDLSYIDMMTGEPLLQARTAEEALRKGVERAAWAQEGYFVVAVKGNANRLKDVLVMDYDGRRWVSLNKSKGGAIARNYVEFSKQALKERAEASYPLEQQGMWIDFVGEQGEGSMIRFTTDGLVWRNLSADEGLGAEIEEAWNGNYYIRYYPHEHKALYAGGKEGPFFTSVEEARVSILAMLEGFETIEVNNHPVVKFAPDSMPNVFLQTEEGLIPVANQAITLDVYSQRDVIDLGLDLRKISDDLAKTAPEKKIIFNRPATQGNYQPGQIEQYISYPR